MAGGVRSTLGLGWIVVSGHFFKLIINSTILIDAEGRRVGRLVCDYDVELDPGRIARWILLSLATLGAGLLLYSFRAALFGTTRLGGLLTEPCNPVRCGAIFRLSLPAVE